MSNKANKYKIGVLVIISFTLLIFGLVILGSLKFLKPKLEAMTVVDSTVQGDPNRTEQSYTLSWRIANVVPNWTRAIDVRVTWEEANDSDRSVTLSSIRYNRERL